MKKTAVILMNLGGPSCEDEIKPFLFSLFSDPAIISLPQPVRWGVAKLITARRVSAAREIYAQLGGRSPLLKNTEAQRDALEFKLGEGYKAFIAMRHAFPRTEDTVREVEIYGPDEIVLLPLYPQLSTTTTSSSFKEWYRCFQKDIPIREICCYSTEPSFIEAHVNLLLITYEEAKQHGRPRVLLTAHGLPEKTIRKGDPYQYQVEQTAAAIIDTCGIPGIDVAVCYQSRVGPLKWIGPSTEDEIKTASRQGRPLVVVPISFVSEHSETLVELDIEYRELAEENGCPAYIRTPALGTHPSYIQALVNLVSDTTRSRVCSERCSQCLYRSENPKEKRVA